MRGHLLQLRQAFDYALIPMVMIDYHRRLIEVNAAARLLSRMSLEELRRHHIDDLTAPEDWARMEDAWEELFEHGAVSGRYSVTFKDGSTMRMFYAALANALPGQHLILFVPSDWSGDDLEEMRPSEEGARRGPLSTRQLDVLRLVAVGASAGQIADQLSISAEATVRTHVRHILDRLGANNRAHAVAIAMDEGLLGESGLSDGRVGVIASSGGKD